MVKKTGKVQDLAKKVEELEAHWKRALADYHNLERRVEKEREEMVRFSSAVVALKFLPVLDNLEKAAAHLQDSGLEMIISQFKDALRSEGIEEVEAQGVEFDPNFMEAVKTVPGEEDNIVAEVLQTGYRIGDKALRPAHVVVAKKEF